MHIWNKKSKKALYQICNAMPRVRLWLYSGANMDTIVIKYPLYFCRCWIEADCIFRKTVTITHFTKIVNVVSIEGNLTHWLGQNYIVIVYNVGNLFYLYWLSIRANWILWNYLNLWGTITIFVDSWFVFFLHIPFLHSPWIIRWLIMV